MGSSTFNGPVRSESSFKVVSKSATTGAYTDSFTLDSSGLNATPVSATASTLTVTAASHAGRTVLLDRAAGIAVTLPAATGTGHSYKFFVKTTITSNSTTIKVADATDVMAGVAIVANDTDNSASIFETAATTDTVTFNGSTTGGIAGAVVELQDLATNLWSVKVTGAATGNEATPFSATVS